MEVEGLDTKTLSAAPPVMPWEQFADWVHIPPGVFRGWIDRGFVPTVRIGKYVMVNVTLFNKQLLEKEDM